jgi:excisionase family DNA binding protein
VCYGFGVDDDTKTEPAGSPSEKHAMLTTAEAMAELHVSKATLFALMKSGALKSVLVGPRMRRIRRYELEEYIRGLPTSIPTKKAS